MKKDTRFINIYLKIHKKSPLTWEDLRYLAEYDPECFEKTCKNVVYNLPEVKPIMEPDSSEDVKQESELPPSQDEFEPERFEWQSIENILENLKRMEISELPVTDIDADEVKDLLGNLYMEKLFPHNDKYAFMDMPNNGNPPLFDKKA
ncbi:MAG: hypothetical protein NC231_08060 [Bacillus sp. (in: Bacteria)]|nr:hypothetical protein [Bacillus sp. (in: firmicutes)]MCM1427070.1 hypothetical protein [Eubacterium sp.]